MPAPQFRAARPMLPRNPTPVELQHLRRVAGLPNSRIRYLSLHFLPKQVLQVFAYAYVLQAMVQ